MSRPVLTLPALIDLLQVLERSATRRGAQLQPGQVTPVVRCCPLCGGFAATAVVDLAQWFPAGTVGHTETCPLGQALAAIVEDGDDG